MMIRYRVGVRPNLRALCSPYVVNPCRGERRRMWRRVLSQFTRSGKARSVARGRALIDAIESFHGDDAWRVADRVGCAIVDRALRGAWRPVQGDA